MDENIQKQLKTDYEDLEIKPSANLWEQIELGLDNNSEMGQKDSFQWWKYAAVIVLFITVGSLIYFNSDKPLDAKRATAHEISSDNNVKQAEKFEIIIPSKDKIQNSVANLEKKQKVSSEKAYEKSIKFTQPTEIANFTKKPAEIRIVENILLQNPETSNLKPSIAESKKSSYINAEDLLLGRELDKTRVEIKNHRQFGILDASKLKFKRPSSLQVFGVHVFADSIVSE
jgi:hypothetical protein